MVSVEKHTYDKDFVDTRWVIGKNKNPACVTELLCLLLCVCRGGHGVVHGFGVRLRAALRCAHVVGCKKMGDL